jgi:hypothetical protein
MKDEGGRMNKKVGDSLLGLIRPSSFIPERLHWGSRFTLVSLFEN